jgi:LysM repeat protein
MTEEEWMRLRRGALVTTAGAFALVLSGGPMLAGPTLGANPHVVVHPGDTLGAIALRFRTSVARLAALNRLPNLDLIFPGQVLVLPQSATSKAAWGAVASGIPPITHVVRWGETLSALAARYGTTVQAILELNGLANPNHIESGQQLHIPGRGSAASPQLPSVSTLVHVVRAGETLTGIARRYRTSLAVLVRLNQLPRANYIRIGQRLLIPGTPARAQTGSSTARFEAETRALMARRAAVRNLIAAEARRAGVPVPLALAVGWQESGWRQRVVSSAGAIGVMQLLPATAEWVADAMLHAPLDIHNTRSNVRTGVTLLKHYLRRYGGDRRLALAAYYQGQRAVDRYGIFPVSRPYIASILLLEEMLQP